MSTFYLMPPRPLLGTRFADYLGTLFPGLNRATFGWPELVDMLNGVVSRLPDVYIVYREDLPEGEEPAHALVQHFGAEAGDEIVEVSTDFSNARLQSRRWQLQ